MQLALSLIFLIQGFRVRYAESTPNQEAGCCPDPDCKSYRGFHSTTVFARKCVPWSSLPAGHTWAPGNNPDSGLESNYCRNPSDHSQAWCYVNTEGSQWGNCDIRTCPSGAAKNPTTTTITTTPPITTRRITTPTTTTTTPTTSTTTTPTTTTSTPTTTTTTPTTTTTTTTTTAALSIGCCMERDCRDYQGAQSVTKSGKTCEPWPTNDEAGPYCRNRLNAPAAYCYVKDAASVQTPTKHETCEIPRCPESTNEEIATQYGGDSCVRACKAKYLPNFEPAMDCAEQCTGTKCFENCRAFKDTMSFGRCMITRNCFGK